MSTASCPGCGKPIDAVRARQPGQQLAPEGIGTFDDDPLALTAKTESCFSSCVPWHDGHSGVRLPWTNCSNLASHAAQRYSKIGIA